VSLEVFWPTSGIRQVFHDVPLDTRIAVREGGEPYRVLETAKFELGAK
jgi:hypothetical protein